MVFFTQQALFFIRFYSNFVETKSQEFFLPSRKPLRRKVTPDLHLTYSKKRGKPGVGTENEKYSLSLNFIDKTCKIYLFIFV